MWIKFCFSRIYWSTKVSVTMISRQAAAMSFREKSLEHILEFYLL